MIPSEQNDRLRELAGGCRHEYNAVPNKILPDLHRCQRCGFEWLWCDNRPAVGDGHQMTLGEMVRLCRKILPDAIIRSCVSFGEELWTITTLGGQWTKRADTPELALAAAILAAVDGGRR